MYCTVLYTFLLLPWVPPIAPSYQQYLYCSQGVQRGTKGVSQIKQHANSSPKLRTEITRYHKVGASTWRNGVRRRNKVRREKNDQLDKREQVKQWVLPGTTPLVAMALSESVVRNVYKKI